MRKYPGGEWFETDDLSMTDRQGSGRAGSSTRRHDDEAEDRIKSVCGG